PLATQLVVLPRRLHLSRRKPLNRPLPNRRSSMDNLPPGTDRPQSMFWQSRRNRLLNLQRKWEGLGHRPPDRRRPTTSAPDSGVNDLQLGPIVSDSFNLPERITARHAATIKTEPRIKHG